MIVSFRCKETEKIFHRARSRKFPTDIIRRGRRKLLMLHAASELNSLKVPPSNRLEKLSRDRKGQHSIRINDQWRICFRWVDGHAQDVEIVDYH